MPAHLLRDPAWPGRVAEEFHVFVGQDAESSCPLRCLQLLKHAIRTVSDRMAARRDRSDGAPPEADDKIGLTMRFVRAAEDGARARCVVACGFTRTCRPWLLTRLLRFISRAPVLVRSASMPWTWHAKPPSGNLWSCPGLLLQTPRGTADEIDCSRCFAGSPQAGRRRCLLYGTPAAR